MTTFQATKLFLCLAVCLLGMSAYSAHPAGVAWVNKNHWHTCQYRLVGDEHTELVERPTMPLRSLRFPNRRSRTNTREVFKGNRRVRVFGCLNEFSGNAVIDISPKSGFSTTDFPQLSLTCFRCFLLELSPLSEILHSHLLNLVIDEYLTIARYGDLVHAKIHPDYRLGIDGRFFWHITGSVEIEVAIPIHQINLSRRRMARRSTYPQIRSYSDAMSLGCPDSDPSQMTKKDLQNVKVLHYGIVRKPSALIEKQMLMTQWWGYQELDAFLEEGRRTGTIDWAKKHGNDKVMLFKMSHPKCIQKWVGEREDSVRTGHVQ